MTAKTRCTLNRSVQLRLPFPSD